MSTSCGPTPTSDIVSRHFNIQIRDFADLEKIRMPVVTHNEAATHYRYEAMCGVYDDILPVKKVGQTHIWFTPWDYLIRWWGIQEAMIDMVERPELVHAGGRADGRRLDDRARPVRGAECSCRWTATTRGSAPAATATRRSCPARLTIRSYVRPQQHVGLLQCPDFSEVSPQMHWEFAMKHDLRWLARWGLTYYGCCEPLDQKIDILRRIPNLRKISVSPWCNTERVVDRDRHRLRPEPQAEPGGLRGGRVASGPRAAGSVAVPGTSRAIATWN